jgi:hypothetical protein
MPTWEANREETIMTRLCDDPPSLASQFTGTGTGTGKTGPQLLELVDIGYLRTHRPPSEPLPNSCSHHRLVTR